MKCPYRNFEECLIEKCPSCNYEEVKQEVIAGRYPAYMSTQTAIENGMAWKETQTSYKFVSCKLVDNAVQPIPPKKEIVNNTTRTSILVKKSIFG